MKTPALLCKIICAMILLASSLQISAQCNVSNMNYSSVPAPVCSTLQSVPVAPGFFFLLPTTANTYYDYFFVANGCGNTSGMCITGLNGSGFANFSNVANAQNWFSGTCTSVELSAFKTAASNGCSTLLQYRYSTPSTPSFTSAPTSACAKTNVTYSVAATTATTSYVWTVSGAGGTIVSGQGTTSIVVSFATAGTGSVSVHGTNNGFCNSTTVTVPSITVAGITIASSQTICSGSSATLTATASGGTGTASYQWQSSPNQATWTNAGTNSSSFSTGVLAATTYYRCIYTNSAGLACASITSNVDTITVIGTQAVITSSPAVDTICNTSSGSISITATNAVTYQWQYFNGVSFVNVSNGTPTGITYTNATTASLGIATTSSTPLGNYRYQCVVNPGSGCGSVTSSGTTVTISAAPPAAPVAKAPTNISCNSLTLNWNSSANATSYYVDVAYDGGFTEYLPGWDETNVGNVNSVNITGLTAWLPYYFRIRAADHCTGDVSVGDTVFTLPAAPAAPSDNSYYNFEYTTVPSANDQEAFTIYGTGNPSFLQDFSVVSGTPNIYANGNLAGVSAFEGNQYTLSAVCGVASNWSEGLEINHTFQPGKTYNVAMALRNVPYPPATSPNPLDIQFVLLQSPLANTFIPGNGCSPTPAIPSNALVVNSMTGYATNAWGVVSFPISGLTTNYSQLWIREAFSNGDPLQTTLLALDSIVISQTSTSSEAAINVTCSSFTATWAPTENATGYAIDVATDASFTSFVSGWNNNSVGNVTSVSVTGLTGGTTYYFRVRAIDNCGTSSNSVTDSVTIFSSPNITTQPVSSVTVCRGDTTSTSVTASGNGLVYQWQYKNAGNWGNVTNGVPVGLSYFGANSAVLKYTTSSATPAGTYQYRCIVSSVAGCGNDTSQVTSLVVNSAPVITSCPGSQTMNTDFSLCDATVYYPAAVVTGSPAPTVTYSQNSGTIFSLGVTTVTVTATNSCGTTTCSFDVTIVDHQPPSIMCPGTQVLDLGSDCSAALPDYTSMAITSDNCSTGQSDGGQAGAPGNTIVVTQSPAPGTVQNGTGTTTVTLTATDSSGNSNSCTFNVTVTDTTAPAAICQDVSVYLDNTGNASVTASQVNNGSYDNCGIASVTVSPNSFTCTNAGGNPVTLTVTDINGNVSSCSSTVTVVDTLAPVAICKNVTTQLDGSGNAYITADQVNNGSYDNCGIQSVSVSPNVFTCANVGANAVTLTVTDVNGNVATCSSTVTVQDNIAPVAICKEANVYLDATGAASVTADQLDGGSYDNCGIASLSVSPNTFVCGNIGPNMVTLTVTDVNGNSSSCTTTVNVMDGIAPTAICQDVTVQLDAAGNASVTAGQVDNGSYDNCGIGTLSVSPNTFTCANVGANPVTLTVTDVNGNVSTCSSVVTVQDNIAPTAICQSVTVNLDATGNATVTADQVNNGSYDNCGIASLSVSPNTFNCSNVGPNTVTLTVTDVNGNVSTCINTVTVLDVTPPTAICQATTIYLNATGNATLAASQVDGGSYDNCSINSISVTPNTFSCINVGANTVLLTVTDANANSSACTSVVTVLDTIAPTAICQPVTVQLDASGNASVTAAQVNNGSYDNCSIASLSVSPNTFTCANVGANSVTLTVTDASGNVSTCTTTVTVQDNVAPTAICQPVTVQLDASGHASVTAAQVNNGSYDNCGVASISVSPNSFTCSNVGANTVTLTVTDVNGNSSTCTTTVTVQDNIAPTAICQAVTVQLDASGNASVTTAQVNNGSYDNCGIASLSVSPNTFNCSNVGANTVTLTVTDVNGNVSTCTTTVTVQDNTAPVAICQPVTVQLDASGNGSVTATQVNNGSHDNCGIASLSVSPNSFTCANTGANTVTLTVTDVNGNVSTCTTTVTVQDNVAPTASCKSATVYLNASGAATVTAAQVDNGSSDACGIASRSVSPSSFTCSNLGANTVTLTVTDVHGNASTCNATVTVVDTTAPTAICKDISVALGSGGTVSITASQVNNGSSDNCSIASMSVSPSTFGCSNLGANAVTLTVTDEAGNVSTCSSTVTVTGSNPTCSISYTPSTTNVIGSSNVGGVTGTIFLGYGPQSFTLNSSVSGGSSFTYSWSGSSLSCYTCANPVFTPTSAGNYHFTLTVTNDNGCTSTCTITICVIDANDPSHNGKILMCQVPEGNPGNSHTISISVNGSDVQSHLSNGCYLGACDATCGTDKSNDLTGYVPTQTGFDVHIFPNPFTSDFQLRIETTSDEKVNVRIFDLTGQLIEERFDVAWGTDVNLGEKLANGVYLVEVKQGQQSKIMRVIKSE